MQDNNILFNLPLLFRQYLGLLNKDFDDVLVSLDYRLLEISCQTLDHDLQFRVSWHFLLYCLDDCIIELTPLQIKLEDN